MFERGLEELWQEMKCTGRRTSQLLASMGEMPRVYPSGAYYQDVEPKMKRQGLGQMKITVARADLERLEKGRDEYLLCDLD